MSRARFSSVAFTSVYCVAYIAVLATDAALFRYYPLVGEWVWGWQRLEESGPSMSWYGLMASAALPAVLAGVVSGGLALPDRWRNHAWVPPVVAMVACVYLMRRFFI